MPKEYFDTHKSRPVIPVYIINETDENLKNLFKKIRNSIGKANKELKSVSAFMWHFMGKIECTLKKSWVANGQLIGNEGQVLTRRSLIKPDQKSLEINVESGVEVSEDQAWQLFWALIGAYRLASLKGKSDHYVKLVTTRVTGHFRLSPFEANVGDAVPMTIAPMLDKLEYTGLIAAVDMFFNRFSDHEFASCRLGTLS